MVLTASKKALFRELTSDDLLVITKRIVEIASYSSNDITISAILTDEVRSELSEWFYPEQISHSIASKEFQNAIDNYFWEKNFGAWEELREHYISLRKPLVDQLHKKLNEGNYELEVFLRNSDISFESLESTMLKRKQEIANLQSQIKLIENELNCLKSLYKGSKKQFLSTPRLKVVGFCGDKLLTTMIPFEEEV